MMTVETFNVVSPALAHDFPHYTTPRMPGLQDRNGVDLTERWKDGVSTYLGLMVSDFPNMFMTYSPQFPIALANGTSIIEAQVETIVDMVARMEKEGVKSIDAQKGAEAEWKASLTAMAEKLLMRFTSSWWNGGNIPGKKTENMNYVAGLATYEKQCRATFEGEKWKGFRVER